MDVNAIVAHNIRAIRRQQGLTQTDVAERLAQLTGTLLPQASISAMERSHDGDRRRRFDAHELYLLATIFDVPIVYFLLPPDAPEHNSLAHTNRPVTDLVFSVLGCGHQRAELDRRLAALTACRPDDPTPMATSPDQYHAWRQQRIRALAHDHIQHLADTAAEYVAEFALQISQLGTTAGHLPALPAVSGEGDDDVLPHE